MTDRDIHVATLLDEAVPSAPVGPDRWEAVVHEADVGDRPAARRWLAAGFPAALAVAVGVIVVVLVWPFGGRSGGTVLERALAAVGDGPVLHVVFQEGWHGTRVDLATGRRTEIHGEREAWYDPARGVHEVSRFDGVPQSDVLYPRDRLPAVVAQAYAGLLDGYRGALRSGSVGGEPGRSTAFPCTGSRCTGSCSPMSRTGSCTSSRRSSRSRARRSSPWRHATHATARPARTVRRGSCGSRACPPGTATSCGRPAGPRRAPP